MARSKAEIKAIIAGGRRPERVVPVPMRGDLAAECEQLERRLAELELGRNQPGASLAGSLEATEVAGRMEAIRAEMSESIVEFRLRALPSKRSRNQKLPTWDQLKDAHPPREGNKKDAESGVDMDAFNEQLLRLSIVDPELDDNDWDNLLEVLTDGTFTLLIGNCYGVNQSDVEVPFSYAALRILENSASG